VTDDLTAKVADFGLSGIFGQGGVNEPATADAAVDEESLGYGLCFAFRSFVLSDLM
jgi:hypothetical protein